MTHISFMMSGITFIYVFKELCAIPYKSTVQSSLKSKDRAKLNEESKQAALYFFTLKLGVP